MAEMMMAKVEGKSRDNLPGERRVSMSNALARAGHGLTLAEKRLVMIAVSRLDSARAPTRPGDVPVTRISAAEYAETFEVDASTAYTALQDGARHLFERKITFFEAAERRGGKPLPDTRVQMRWVGQVHYQTGEGWVELYWWPKLVPHLLGLKKQFTTYQLKQGSALRSAYSWRLLELLMRFEATGVAKYSIEDFCEAMDATEKQKADFHAIRRRIIDPAVAELVEKDHWLIDWTPIKAGRRVAAMSFKFRRNPQLGLFDK